MFIYNITMKVEPAVLEEWLQWQKEEHIPEIMASGCFTDFRFFRLLDIDDSDGPTYVVQYQANSRNEYELYILAFAPRLREKAIARWQQRFVAFRTIMESVN